MNLTSNVQDVVDQVLREWMNDDKVFTAHDVKIEVRERGFYLLHDPCRDYVHAKYENGDFLSNYYRQSTYIHTGDGCQYVMVFFPVHLHPTTHPNAVKSGAPSVTPATHLSRKNNNDPVVEVDSKNRIRIPVSITSALGWSKGTLVAAQERNGSLLVVEVDDDPMSLFPKTHTVDYHGNIRITLSDPRSKEYTVKVEVGVNKVKNTDGVVANPS